MPNYYDPWIFGVEGWGPALAARVDHLFWGTADLRQPQEGNLVDHLKQSIVDLHIPYVAPVWHPTFGQIIRDPDWVLHTGGTCIDLALVGAGLAMHLGLRPVVVLIISEREHHAALAVDLSINLENWTAAKKSPTSLPLTGHRGIKVEMAQLRQVIERGEIAFFDPTELTEGANRHRSNEDQFFEDREGAHIYLVDVQAAMVERPISLERPTIDHRPAISFQAPPMPSWQPYPERELDRNATVEKITTHGFAAIVGQAGFGKSMLARQVASTWARGGWWFLPASTPTTLEHALGTAFAREQGMHSVSAEDFSTFAHAAVDRLRRTVEPWLLVLDNVTDLPSAFGRSGILPPQPGPGHSLIITTTDPTIADAWARWASAPNAVIELKPLSNLTLTEDVLQILDAEKLDASPLNVRLALAVLKRPANEPSTLEPGLTSIVARILETMDPRDRDAALHAAWLPPEGILLGSSGTALIETGLAIASVVSTGGIDLHRMIGAALRASDPHHEHDRCVALLTDHHFLDLLRTSGDLETLDHMSSVLLREGHASTLDHDVALVHLGELLEGIGRVVAPEGSPKAWAERCYLAVVDDAERLARLISYHPTVAAIALHGSARVTNQDGKRSKDNNLLDRAILNVDQAEALRSTANDLDSRRVAARSAALAALLRIKQLRLTMPNSLKRIQLIEVQIELLNTARDARQPESAADASSFNVLRDFARGVFNLGGVWNDLAKDVAAVEGPGVAEALLPVTVAAMFGSAEEAYQHALQLRLDSALLGGKADEYLAACYHGLAIVHYNRAWLLSSLSVNEQLTSLHRAQTSVHQALTIREVIDTEEGTNVGKSLALTAKIAEARLRLRGELAAIRAEVDREVPSAGVV